MAGHCEVTDGDLWEVPAFSSIIHILTLTAVSEKRIDTAKQVGNLRSRLVRADGRRHDHPHRHQHL